MANLKFPPKSPCRGIPDRPVLQKIHSTINCKSADLKRLGNGPETDKLSLEWTKVLLTAYHSVIERVRIGPLIRRLTKV